MKKGISRNTITFSVGPLINHTYNLSLEEHCRALKAKAQEVHTVATSMLSEKNFQVGTTKSSTTFTVFYLMDVTHKSLGTFSMRLVVMA